MNDEFFAKIENQKFYNWVVESAFEKTLLELQFGGVPTPDENEQTKLRAAIAVGVTETLIKLKQLVATALEEDE